MPWTACTATLVAVATLLALPASARGQLPRGVRTVGAHATAVSQREGFPPVPIFDVFEDRDGVLWVGTEDGAHFFAGVRWTRLEFPPDVPRHQVRTIVATADGALWFALRTGVARYAEGRWRTYDADDGLTAPPVYSLVVTTALSGRAELLAGTYRGIFRLGDDERFHEVTIPAPFEAVGTMLAEGAEPDGTPALWVASVTAGVARFAGGRWTAWGADDGLHTDVDFIAPGAAGDPVAAVAATKEGAFVLRRGETRWHAIAGARTPATRALRFLGREGGETWIGTASGLLLRQVDDRPLDTLQAGEGLQRATVQSLRRIERAGSAHTVYAGFTTGRLARFHLGGGGAVRLDGGERVDAHIAHVHEWRAPGGEVRLLVQQFGTGFLTVPGGLVDRGTEARNLFTPVAGLVRSAEGPGEGDDTFLALFDDGIYRRREDRWVRDASRSLGLEGAAGLALAPDPDGEGERLVAGTASGVMVRADSAWNSWPGSPPFLLHGLVADTLSSERRLWAYVDSRLFRYRYAARQWDQFTLLSGERRDGIDAVAAQRLASGQVVLWVGTYGGGLAVGDADDPSPAWTFITLRNRPSLLSNRVRAIRVLANGDVALGTGNGLVLLRPGASLADSIETVTTFTTDDGLPHQDVFSLAPSLDGERIWVGTAGGLALVELAGHHGADPPPRLTLTTRVAGEAGGAIRLADGASLPYLRRDLTFEYFLHTDHRESDTRYELLIDGKAAFPERWTSTPVASALALGVGRHVVEVTAADWRGRVIGPTRFEFRILPPPWRSPLAYLSYAVMAIAALVAGDRVRSARLRRRALELEENERRISASEERFRRLFDDAVDAQLLLREGRVIAANPAAARLLAGGDRQALAGTALEEIVPAGIAAVGESADGAATQWEETTAHTRGGDPIPVAARRLTIDVARDPFEHVELRDLRETHRLQAERETLVRQLNEAQRLEALGNLAGGVAHDFNNLLMVMRANAELAALDLDERSPSHESIRAVLRASERARDLVRQILTFSRRDTPRRTPVMLGDLLRELHPMLRSTIPSSVRIEMTNHTPGARVLADATQLQQMLLNLCANAEYAMRPTNGGRLRVELDEVPARDDAVRARNAPPGAGAVANGGPAMARIRVSDTGIGMADEVKARIFEPFFTTKPVGEGTGLGLSVLHGIVTSLGGSIHVQSAPGEGSTFDIRLPLLTPATEPLLAGESTAAADATDLSAGRFRVIVVDDERQVADLLREFLRRSGFEVAVFTDPSAALREIALRPYDLVITDQTMPEMTGDVLALRIREAGIDVPIIITTGFSERLTEERLRAARIFRVLEKPFRLQQLREAVDDALARAGTASPPR